ncbi:unnamed protein product [Trifolium pratense]|uniref:Uncharacterized protein n=1 Tax=Trifolium pratense TaxID=57577 RepID=A0ACB0IR68_TRIPR|nr:unnamed protein product [Trifolium pratense]
MANYEEPSDRFTYDVFLSFRGEDTRYSFMGYLLDAFQKRGIKVFYDDTSLKIGEELSPAFYKAIEESNISVIVFSEDYASSKWCLNELAKIMECTKTNKKQIAFPIFYHVDPADVRHQRNSYEEAMIAHEKRFGKDSEKIKAWTAALSKVADLKGHHIHTGHEIDHVKEIAEKVHANIAPKPLLVGENPVGLDQHIEDAKSLLDLKPNDGTVCTLGIIGLGGIGKTELAKALYNKIVHQFEAASFLANVREKSNKINGLEDLQKTLLSEMFQQPKSELGSTSKGIYEIKHKLEKKKVLLVLDDVDEMKQIENLAGGSDWYGPGSRIIITTRDKGLLMGTHQIEVKTYEMTELNNQHSLQLFCRNAFGKNNPKTGYEAMSYRAIGYAKGLPLALKVIGCNLATRKSLKAWEDALKDYERIPRKGIQDVLKVSYDVLEPSAQSVFLDIACFFKGENIEYVEEVLVEFSATSNIEELVNKSLLNVDDGYLNMHDLIQDMGREIVRQEAPNNPAKRSRLWFQQDIIDVLSANDSGSDTIQGIMVGPSIYMTEVYWNDCAFEKMNCLRILIVRNITFSLKPKYLPNHLRLLHWEAYPSKTLPPKFYPRNIIIFNLPNSQLTLTEPFKVRKGRTELEHMMMPAVKVPKWFDYRCKGGFPVFWVRGKFPKIVLAFVFQDAVKQSYPVNLFVELFPLINDKHVPNTSVCEIGIERNHVVVCDLQVLFCGTSIDALLLKNEWNQVHISYEVNDRYELDETTDYYLTVSEWGVFVDKQGIVNLEEHVQFTCPTTKDPIMTIDDFKHDDSNENPAVNENRVDKTIGIEDIPSPTAPEVDETEQYTHMFEENENSNDAAVNENENRYDKTIGTEDIPSPYPSGFFWRLLYTCFCKCFS